MKVEAIVPSAGKGIRIKSCISKPYIKLAGKPILAHTLIALNNSSFIDKIIVAVDRSSRVRARRVAKKYKINKLKAIAQGGATRFKSVLNCLNFLDDDTDYVVIHDGIRPFITGNIIKKAIFTAKRLGACVTGVPLIPTAKKVDRTLRIVSTPPRHQLWIAQTPQVFKKTFIIKAYNLAKTKSINPTDDSMLVELLGKRVKMVKGSYSNIKITTPEDLALAKILVKRCE